jgi:D-alanyl-D-alanine carboxypeptidase
MVSTAADVARWACALFEGKVLSAASLNQMLAFREVSVPPTPIVGYGLGALRTFFAGREYWGHGGNMIGNTTIMLYAPKERVSIAVLINQDFVDYEVGAPLLGAMVNAIQP